MLNDTMRIELQPLGIKVIHIVTGGIATKFFHQAAGQSVPEGSVYTPILEDIMNGVSGRDAIELQGTAVDVYARNVVSNVLSRNPSTTFVSIYIQLYSAMFPSLLPRRVVPMYPCLKTRPQNGHVITHPPQPGAAHFYLSS